MTCITGKDKLVYYACKLEFKHKSDQNIVLLALIIGPILLHIHGSWPTRERFLHSWAATQHPTLQRTHCITHTATYTLQHTCTCAASYN